MATDLSRAISDAVIRRLAGDRSYQRGLDYYLHGHVESIEERADCIRAVVRGNQDYTVELSSDEEMLDYSCDCPHGSEGAFCKHCVATALAWLNRSTEPAKSKRCGMSKEVTLADVEKILLAEEKNEIVRMLLEWAKTDGRLRERLILHAARRTGAEASLAAVRNTFHQAVRVRGFVHYREIPSYVRNIDRAIDGIEQMLRDGLAAGVVELSESAMATLVEGMGSVDDSDGYMSGLRERLEELHYRACLEARPDPADLARRLFQRELYSDFEVFFGAVSRYAAILGPEGMEVYRNLAEEEWEKVPERTSADRESGWGKHFRITHIMENLARLSGDVEQLVGVMGRDLSHAYNYLRIAEVYREARQHDKALEWAERGLKVFPERTDNRLREFVAEEYHRRKRHVEAMKLIWAEFSERPLLESYRILERHAKKARSWEAWRERAIAEVRQRIRPRDKNAPGLSPRWGLPNDASQLVRIYLYERNPDDAWNAAREGGCWNSLWIELAGAREKTHPEDSVPIYLQQAEAAVKETNNSAYESAVGLLIKAAALMKRLGNSDEFVRHLESLRVQYKIKRNFIKLLDEKRRSLYLQ